MAPHSIAGRARAGGKEARGERCSRAPAWRTPSPRDQDEKSFPRISRCSQGSLVTGSQLPLQGFIEQQRIPFSKIVVNYPAHTCATARVRGQLHEVRSHRRAAVPAIHLPNFSSSQLTLCPLTTTPASPPLSPGHHRSTLRVYESDLPKHLIQVGSYSISLSVAGLFHLA